MIRNTLRRFPLIGSMLALTALSGLAMAQDDVVIPLNSQIATSGVLGLAPGDTAQLNLLNPGLPAPFLGVICLAQVSFVDDQNNELKSAIFRVLPGHSVALTLDADTDVTFTDSRLEIRGLVRTPPNGILPPGSLAPTPLACRLIPAVEVFNNETSRTRLVLTDFQVVFPPLPPPPLSGSPK